MTSVVKTTSQRSPWKSGWPKRVRSFLFLFFCSARVFAQFGGYRGNKRKEWEKSVASKKDSNAKWIVLKCGGGRVENRTLQNGQYQVLYKSLKLFLKSRLKSSRPHAQKGKGLILTGYWRLHSYGGFGDHIPLKSKLMVCEVWFSEVPKEKTPKKINKTKESFPFLSIITLKSTQKRKESLLFQRNCTYKLGVLELPKNHKVHSRQNCF